MKLHFCNVMSKTMRGKWTPGCLAEHPCISTGQFCKPQNVNNPYQAFHVETKADIWLFGEASETVLET